MRSRIPFVPLPAVLSPADPTECGNCGATVRADQTTVLKSRVVEDGKVIDPVMIVRCVRCASPGELGRMTAFEQEGM